MIACIIVEYNPMHNGHLYHIAKTREILDRVSPLEPNYVVAIMSGNFCQRGEICVLNKYTRAKLAIECGVDMVIELPSIYATSSAEYFAKGAMQVISKIKGVGVICFGSESGDIEELKSIANLSNDSVYNTKVKEYMSNGKSYPASCELAMKDIGIEDAGQYTMPNNTLAIEYIKQAKVFRLVDKLYTISRQGNGYNDLSCDKDFVSASCIRDCITKGKLDGIIDKMPKCVLDSLKECEVNYEKLYGVISTQALSATSVYEDNEGIINRIKRYSQIANSYTELVDLVHTKRYTKGKIKRILLHLTLGHNASDITHHIGKVKVLAIRNTCKHLLSMISPSEDSYHIDMDTYVDKIYNIVSRDKITSQAMRIV